MARPQTARPTTARTRHGSTSIPQRPLTARIPEPADTERGTTPRVRRLAIASDGKAVAHSSPWTGQGLAASRPGRGDETERSQLLNLGKGTELESTLDPKEVKRQVLRHIRMLAGSGDHLEREQAVNELSEFLQKHQITRSWLIDQGHLVENLVALAQLGTPGQKDGTAVLLCLLADGSLHIKEALVRVPRTIAALVRLLQGPTDVQRVNAAATIWFLAEIDEFNEAVQEHGQIYDLLVECIDTGTSPQSEHACGALRMLTFQKERNALSVLQIQRLPEILLNAAKSESHSESQQAVSLIAQLSSFESINHQFCSHFAALEDSLECLLRILGQDGKHREVIEIKLQASICLRNLLTLPHISSLARTIKQMVPLCIKCFSNSDGLLRIRVLGTLKALTNDEDMRTTIGRERSIFPALLSMMCGKGNELEVNYSLTFMKVISQGRDVACQEVMEKMLVALMDLCRDKTTGAIKAYERGDISARKSARTDAGETIPEDNLRIKAAAVLRNLASKAEFCLMMSETEGMFEVLAEMLSACPKAGYRQALGAFCNFAALDSSAKLMLSFRSITNAEDAKKLPRENIILRDLLELTKATDEWTSVQSIVALQNLLEHEHDISEFEATMVQNFHENALQRSDATKQIRIKSAMALASLTSRESACSIIASLPENADTRIFGNLIGLERPDAHPDEVVVGLWALSNVAALPTNIANKFLEVDFLLDKLGQYVANGRDEERVAAAAGTLK